MDSNDVINELKKYEECVSCIYSPQALCDIRVAIKHALDLIYMYEDKIAKLEHECEDKERAYNEEYAIRHEVEAELKDVLSNIRRIFVGYVGPNRVRLYEGDIIHMKYTTEGSLFTPPGHEEYTCLVVYDKERFCWSLEFYDGEILPMDECYLDDIEVVGNLADNPDWRKM